MSGRRISLIFAGVVVAAVVGWIVGSQLRDALSSRYDVAVSVVGEGAELATPTPATVSPETSPSVSPEAPTQEPRRTRPPSVICDGEPPSDNCDCDLKDGDFQWVCPIPDDQEEDN
jgi:hypothetical protein